MRVSILFVALAAGVGLSVVAPQVASAQAPPHWTCPATYVGDGYCDCGCGNYDPDCDTSASNWNNCTNGFDCTAATDPEGRYSCDSTRKVGVPTAWTRNSTWWDDDFGCDCNSGAVDPDCGDPAESVLWCSTGQVCSPTGLCVAPSTPPAPVATVTTLHFGGMCSVKFEESQASSLNSTSYRVRLANTPNVEVDAGINMKTVSNIQGTYTSVYNKLYQYCRAPNTCHIYAYSAGASAVQYAIAANPTLFTGIGSVRLAAGADGGSDLAGWGRLAELAACPMASTLSKTTQRALFNHNAVGNMGKTVYRSGGKGHDWYKPWGWSSAILWAGTSQCSGEDDGAVGLDSAGGCTTSSGRSDLNCTKFTGNVCATSGCPVYKLDHYEMKIKPMLEAGW